MANYLKSSQAAYDYILTYTTTHLPDVSFSNIMARFDALFTDIKTCQYCSKNHIKHDNWCSRDCKSKDADKKYKKIISETNLRYMSEGGIICLVCNDYCRHDIRQHIRRDHGLSISDYKINFCGEVMSDHRKTNISQRLIGDKNPAYNHGGKFSAMSKNFIKYVDKTEEEIRKIKNDISNKISHSNKNNGNNNTTLTYWINQGFTEKEAKEKLATRQSTFSLEKCIEKYGSESGLEKWLSRQEKWQKTLQSKEQHEIDEINMKKSKGRMSQLFSRNEEIKHIPAILYYVRFFDINTNETLFWKIGITSKSSVSERFKSCLKYGLDYEIINEERGMTFYEVYKKEQKLLREYHDYRVMINHNGFKTTEAFNTNILCH